MPNTSSKYKHPYPHKKLARTSNAMTALYFAKSLNKPFTYQDLAEISPNRFTARHKRSGYLQRLADMELIDPLNDGTYVINAEGIRYVYAIGAYYAQFN
jgi:hypothetical protein